MHHNAAAAAAAAAAWLLQYYLLRSPRTAEQFHRCKLFRNLTPWQTPSPSSFPFPPPRNPTTSNNHALLRMIHVRIPCPKEHETRRKHRTRGQLHTAPNPTDSWKLHESSGS
ncbi:hypothetical protein GQ607_016844 [Colletotrichum asianum]|uniref:Uncharacterized protein n=1 Tax=Colletotrichum asianum TaxID=702518 RepID=A0A8H3ZJL5_9PEZI|nr:hypothetical protein GQ607_016844 [Colletotrichum asianum]